MAYTAPGTAVAGEVLTAAYWNEQVRDNMIAVAGTPMARNILYNGAMQVAQRGTSVTGISSGGVYHTSDRWVTSLSSLGTWTQSVENDAPTGSGLRKSLKMLCTTADASPAAGDYGLISQRLEGQDLQRIAKGTSSANPLVLSFWVKSNVTGTFIASLEDSDNTRFVSQSYTVSASGVWEQKKLTFPADTTGVLDNDANTSLTLHLWLGAGSSYTSGTLQTTWAANGFTNVNNVAGQTNLASAINNYWQVTGVQLETGSVATGFEFLPFGDELARCQRYFVKQADPTHVFFAYDAAIGAGSAAFPVTLRSNPTSIVLSYAGTSNAVNRFGVGVVTGVTATIAGPYGFNRINKSAGWTAGNYLEFYYEVSAEL